MEEFLQTFLECLTQQGYVQNIVKDIGGGMNHI